MGHQRKLVFGGSSLTLSRGNKFTLEVMKELRDEFEQILINHDFFDGLPFTWIGLMLRFGLKNDDKPLYQRIDKNDGELPLTIELDTNEIQSVDRDELKRLFSIATLKSLIHVAKKYKLPQKKYAVFESKLDELTG
ncbi:MAG: Imm39 family immunity protein [Candidatus Auribacterota bacterium]